MVTVIRGPSTCRQKLLLWVTTISYRGMDSSSLLVKDVSSGVSSEAPRAMRIMPNDSVAMLGPFTCHQTPLPWVTCISSAAIDSSIFLDADLSSDVSGKVHQAVDNVSIFSVVVLGPSTCHQVLLL